MMDTVPDYQPWLAPDQIWSLFGQDEFWIDRHHRHHQLAEMEDRYLINLHRFIYRNRAILTAAAWWLPFPNLNGDMAQYHAESEYERMTEELHTWAGNPHNSPLGQGIAAELRSRGYEWGEVGWRKP